MDGARLQHASRRQKTLAANISYRKTKGPLHLLIDSTGIKVEREGEWHARKCHDAISDRGAHAVRRGNGPPEHFLSFSLPHRENAKPWQTVTAGAMARNEALRAAKYFGWALWRRWN